MSTREQRAQALVDQVDDTTTRLLSNQLKLVRLAYNKDKSIATVSAETTDIEACTSGIIRAVEDMLVISRNLKEAWVLGQIKKSEDTTAQDQVAEREKHIQELAQSLGSIKEWL